MGKDRQGDVLSTGDGCGEYGGNQAFPIGPPQCDVRGLVGGKRLPKQFLAHDKAERPADTYQLPDRAVSQEVEEWLVGEQRRPLEVEEAEGMGRMVEKGAEEFLFVAQPVLDPPALDGRLPKVRDLLAKVCHLVDQAALLAVLISHAGSGALGSGSPALRDERRLRSHTVTK